MKLFFADDVRRDSEIAGMGELIGVGGIMVDANKIKLLEARINSICERAGFDTRYKEKSYYEFKWSPASDQWMHSNLTEDARESFFTDVIRELREHNVKATVILEDASSAYRHALSDADDTQEDVTGMLLEKANGLLERENTTGLVIVDRPSGGRSDEADFLSDCAVRLMEGTEYVKMDNIAINVVTAPSKHIRLLQAADLVASCTASRVSGEDTYSPPVFSRIVNILDRDWRAIHGYGLKIFPDLRYANLYHWLYGEELFYRRPNSTGIRLPIPDRPYPANPYGVQPTPPDNYC